MKWWKPISVRFRQERDNNSDLVKAILRMGLMAVDQTILN